MHLNLLLGARLAGEIPAPDQGQWLPGTIVDMKLRSFISPGSSLRLEARLKHLCGDSARLTLKTSAATEVIASGGVLLKAKEPS